MPTQLISPPAAVTLPKHPARAPVGRIIANVIAIVLPFIGLIAAIAFLWGRGFSWVDFGLMGGLYLLTLGGITIGYHRLFTHRSFETTKVIQFALAAFGGMAVQGSLFKWVGSHRKHHQHSDTPDDPHSPHHHGDGFWGMMKGMWHSHIGWFFEADPVNLNHYVKDLWQSKTLRVASALFPLWVTLGLVLPAVLGGLLTWSWTGALFGLIWGGLVRIFFVHHVTWSINSICHLWGGRPYDSDDLSRNNAVFGILALGEGWHNNHHAFPTSARHGLKWWQFDASYLFIRMLEKMGLAWNVKLPNEKALAGAAV